MIDFELLKRFATEHLGVGSVKSPIWFIGPEPAGTGSIQDLSRRLNAFEHQGCSSLTNLRTDLTIMSDTKWFLGSNPPTQAYWRRVAHLDLLLQNGNLNRIGIEDIRRYQQKILLAEPNVFYNVHAPVLMELSAMPARSTGHWPYADWETVPDYLSTRWQYQEQIMKGRIRLIIETIETHRPKLVLFCGPTYQTNWSKISSKLTVPNEVIPHPNAYGMTNSDWDNLGIRLRQKHRTSIV
jgi:hypothetical protein